MKTAISVLLWTRPLEPSLFRCPAQLLWIDIFFLAHRQR